VRILLTNDDGFNAPGLRSIQRVLRELGHVDVVAPRTEQSGVSHSITYLRPLTAERFDQDHAGAGWAVDGSPADCVKLGISELLDQPPDLVVSGINRGLNAGINVLYSGTVAAALEGAFFGINSIAISLEETTVMPYREAAEIAGQVIGQVLAQQEQSSSLYNLNIPLAACQGSSSLRVVPMAVARYGENFLKRTDPKGRTYYWATTDPPPPPEPHPTDVSVLEKGYVSLTPLGYNLTQSSLLQQMQQWELILQENEEVR
jgi:5'-nucleotidase